jgi:hypothetical protein
MNFRFQRASMLGCLAAAMALLATGCAAPGSGNAGITASENSVAKVSNVGFLSDPAKLRVQPVARRLAELQAQPPR